MKIKLINYGYKTPPKRQHHNDAGADLSSTQTLDLKPHSVAKIPLGYGIKLPDGFAAFVLPRSGLASKGITCEVPPIDSGYTGEIHAIVTNNTDKIYHINEGDRIGQLVITPIIISEFTEEEFKERGSNGFASTGV